MEVDANNALVVIDYACVMEAPTHGATGNPEFIIRVCEQTDRRTDTWAEVPISDSLFYIVQAPDGLDNLPEGWSGYTSGNCKFVYKPWTRVSVNLYNYLYRKVRIEIYIADCSAQFHGSYAYISGRCGPVFLEPRGCAAGENTEVATVTASEGMAEYRWFKSNIGPTTSEDKRNYTRLDRESSRQLAVDFADFILTDNATGRRDTLTEQTFMCEMISYMDPSKPVSSSLIATVGNKKPTLMCDSLLYCDGSIWLHDRSVTRFTDTPLDEVDTNASRWVFYDNARAVGQPLDTLYGGSVRFTFQNSGAHSVKLCTFAHDATCFNEKLIPIRSLAPPVPRIGLGEIDLCANDTIVVSDRTERATYHRWHIRNTQMDTTFEQAGTAFRWVFPETTHITLLTHSAVHALRDTNGDGLADQVFCNSTLDTVVLVEDYPVLTVRGDTVVCNGDRSAITVSADLNGCSFDWFEVPHGSTPFLQNSSSLETTLNRDKSYYVKATSRFGCETWDSVRLYLVRPSIACNVDKICYGDSVMLWAGKAATYDWTADPDDDISFIGQEHKDTIVVYPEHSTTYYVVGRGTNGCGATPLSQRITVYPYPVLGVQLTPGYIDSENPAVLFTDVSENATATEWDFGNGQRSSIRSVVHNFTDLSQDSILIKMRSFNALGCYEDTSFYLPVGIFTVWFPNAFTPRLETNNIFKVHTANTLVDYELYVFDRAGNQLFHTNDVEEGWDGTSNGHECPQGSYVYIANYRREGVERLMRKKGTITLLK